jgi:non-canonical (house-cleaning) NTP pyrophosphatase
MKIAVASTSVHKLEAVQLACNEVFGPGVEIQGFKANSGVNEQPNGQAETLLGAENRLAHLIQLIGQTQYDLRVAMEGGIFSIGEGDAERIFDCGWVVASDAGGLVARGTCTGLEYPKDAVAEARTRGFKTTTVGTVLQERGAITDGTDTHASLTNGVLTRAHVLHVGLLSALGQLLRQSEKLQALAKDKK